MRPIDYIAGYDKQIDVNISVLFEKVKATNISSLYPTSPNAPQQL